MDINVSNTNRHAPRILVTDANRGSAITIIRSLGRKGYKVIAADSDPKSLGFRSRFAEKTLLYPAPQHSPRAFVEFLLTAVKENNIDLIIPVTDLTVQPLMESRAQFEKVTRLALPSSEQLAAVTDKYRTVQLAQSLDVPVPETFIVHTCAEALQTANKLGWPLVLKPQSSKILHRDRDIESFQVTYANSPGELERLMNRFEGHCSVLLQRYYEGAGYGVEMLMSKGEPLAVFGHKRRREIPVSGGASVYRESVRLDPELYQYALRLLKELCWTGLAMVEFKVGSHGASLMEINGRVWGSLPLAVKSGVDFPYLLAKLFLEGAHSIKTQNGSDYKIGVRSRNLQGDLMWITSVLLKKKKYPFLTYPNRLRAIMALLGLLNPRAKYDLFAFDDPLPALIELPRIVRKFRSKMREANEE